jgi:predicted alpha/beta hydrolase
MPASLVNRKSTFYSAAMNTLHHPASRIEPVEQVEDSPQHGASDGRCTLRADDGRALAATWTEATGRTRAVAVVHSATGVPQGYYRAFAQWLAGRGYAVLTYDYRGIAASRQGRVQDDPATMRDWAVLDMSAALAAAQVRRAAQDLPLLLVGHSFGGNALGFARGVERADAILTIGAQLPHGAMFPGIHRIKAELFFRAIVPCVVGLTGRLPAWAMGGSGPSLPPGVALQWAAWGRRPGWAYADPAMHTHRGIGGLAMPVHLWNISDDMTFAPPGAVDALAARFRNAAVQRHTLRPSDVGLRRLGHFGAFRREPGARLWSRLLAPIEQASPGLSTALRGAPA